VTLRIAGERLVVELRGKRTDISPGGKVAVRIPAEAIHRLRESSG